MCFLPLPMASSFDPSYLGHAYDHQSYPEDILMEILISDIDDHGQFRNKNHESRPYQEWPGVTTDYDGKVIVIDWERTQIADLSGTINLSWSPSNVQDLRITEHGIHGEINTLALPSSLATLILFRNLFQGTFAIQGLPSEILEVLIHENKFVGCLDLEMLPKRIIELDASKNYFDGSINLKSLPASLICLDLSSNRLCGSIELTYMPKGIEFVSLSNNGFQMNRIEIPRLRPGQEIHLDGNEIVEIVEQIEG